MSSKTDKDKVKQLQDKCQSVLNGLLRDEDNKYCVDCDSKGPRWASWNIGVFLCIRCAGIHRNLGVHITKVKSVNLDSWTPEQVVSLQQMGNSRARAVYEANLPDNFRRPQNDSSLESFIRAKYEHKKYIAREWVPPALPKVNWEKEIDEEMEKQKRKKKTATSMSLEKNKIISSVEVPQLPKPKNPSPKPGRSVTTVASTNSTAAEAKKDGDLLGLQNGDDTFSGFLSASSSNGIDKKEDSSTEAASKSEEESFFNQTVPTEKEKMKLTKDSILALYSNTPANSFNQFSQHHNQQQQQNNSSVSHMPYQQQGNFAGQNNFQSFCGYHPQQNFAPGAAAMQSNTNGMPQFGNVQWGGHPQFTAQGQMQPLVNQFPGPNQFQAQTSLIGQFGNFQKNHSQFPQQPQFAQFQAQKQQTQTGFSAAAAAQQPNSFYMNQNGLQQQFGNLSLNNQTATNPAPTLATNIWQ